MVNYLYRVGIALSVLFNVIVGGPSNQTFSARNYGWKRTSSINGVKLIDLLFGEGHCRMAWVHWTLSKKKIEESTLKG